jgi:hypothetical protein
VCRYHFYFHSWQCKSQNCTTAYFNILTKRLAQIYGVWDYHDGWRLVYSWMSCHMVWEIGTNVLEVSAASSILHSEGGGKRFQQTLVSIYQTMLYHILKEDDIHCTDGFFSSNSSNRIFTFYNIEHIWPAFGIIVCKKKGTREESMIPQPYPNGWHIFLSNEWNLITSFTVELLLFFNLQPLSFFMIYFSDPS